jgi:hypothetical protein
MISSEDFRIVDPSDVNKLKHSDKYEDYPRSKFNPDGSTVNIYRSWIARKYPEHLPNRLFTDYIDWYFKEFGNYDNLWISFNNLRSTDYDLNYGYLYHNFLVRVPIIPELFENRFKNRLYIKEVVNALMYDMKRYGRFSDMGKLYGTTNEVIYKLTRSRFKALRESISNKRKSGKSLSYSDLRCLITMYEVYDWRSCLHLANDVRFKLNSKDKRVRRYQQIIAKEARGPKVDTSVNVVNNTVTMSVDEESTDKIWAEFHARMGGDNG